jgi:hypothetical protein
VHGVRAGQARLADAERRQAAGRRLRLDRQLLRDHPHPLLDLDGSALAYESYFCWDDWADYLGVRDERQLPTCGTPKELVSGHEFKS